MLIYDPKIGKVYKGADRSEEEKKKRKELLKRGILISTEHPSDDELKRINEMYKKRDIASEMKSMEEFLTSSHG